MSEERAARIISACIVLAGAYLAMQLIRGLAT